MTRTTRTTAEPTPSLGGPPHRVAPVFVASNARGRPKLAATTEERRLSAMRAVNAASQTLSHIIQSASKGKHLGGAHQDVPRRNLTELTTSAAKSLRELRTLSPQDVNVERAASSVVGKLISLEMFDAGLLALADMKPCLYSLYSTRTNSSVSKNADRLHLLSLPLPSFDSYIDPIVLTLISTYLLHAITLLCHVIFSSTKPQKESPDDFATALTNTPTLVAWMPLMVSLPVKHQDGTLMRAYTVLTASVSAFSSSRTRLRDRTTFFAIRAYSLSCLLHTSPGTIQPDTLWDQAVKFGGTFAKSTEFTLDRSSETEATRIVLSMFEDLVRVASKREDGVFLKGRGFVCFCEYWMGFAQRVGNVGVLGQITKLLESTSARNSLAAPPENRLEIGGEKKETSLFLDSTRICATFAQTTALLERELAQSPGSDKDSMVKCIIESTAVLNKSILVRGDDNYSGAGADLDPQRVRGNMKRSVERMRRAAVKMLDTALREPREGEGQDALKLLLIAVVDTLQSAISTDPDAITSILDTLFVLARVSLDPTDMKTYTVAYDFLAQARNLLGIDDSRNEITAQQANFMRCVSSAFHHLAGTLYQEGIPAPAIRFLKEACVLGMRALGVYRSGGRVNESESAGVGWRLLENQLYRRWELLGICYSKVGDRKPAFEALIESVRAFPYSGTDFLQRVETAGLELLFSASADLKQLGTIIHRLTYLGTCELFLAPNEVSLKHMVELSAPGITGALVERQLEGLEGIVWKEGVRETIRGLLADALEIYTGEDMPVRKARVLLMCLDIAYYVGPEGGATSPTELGQEAVRLLRRNTLGRDAGLARLSSQYEASAHLWLALHAHRRADPEQIASVTQHVEAACGVLKLLAAPPFAGETIVKPSPRQMAAAKTRSGKASAVRRATAPKKVKKIVSKEPVTPLPRKVLEILSTNAVPPRLDSEDKSSAVVFDHSDKLRSLLQMVASLLELLGLVLPKIKILDLARRLCEQQAGELNDGYIATSVDLAHEYLKLGKIKRANAIYGQVLNAIRGGHLSDEICARFFLRYAEALAAVDNVLQSSSIYCEALGLSTTLLGDETGMSTSQKVRARAARLEWAAMAAHAFAMIQYSKEDIATSLEGMLQSLRLWNRAMDTLARLLPPLPSSKPTSDADPFAMTDLNDALPSTRPEPSRSGQGVSRKTYTRRSALDGLGWRIAEGLFATLFSLSQAYFARGSSREAEYFAQQAHDLAESLNAPAMMSRALAKKGEVLLHQGLLKEGHGSLMQATEVLRGTPGTDGADVRRLRGDYSQKTAKEEDAWQLYQEADSMLEELDQMFGTSDGLLSVSTGLSPMANSARETLAPPLMAAVLRQQIWLLRDDIGDNFKNLLDRFLALPTSFQTKVEENALIAKLTLHHVYGRFHADIFLSSLAESTISLPMGMSGERIGPMSSATQEILVTLDNAEKLFWAGLVLMARRGGATHVRDAAVSLVMIKALQTSLGQAGKEGPILTANLLDVSSAITLRREMLETIQHKFLDFQTHDDLHWPLITPNGTPLPRPKNRMHARFDSSIDSEDSEDSRDGKPLKQYWETIRAKYLAHTPDPTTLSLDQADKLPANWTVINISVTEDKSTMFVSRQRPNTEPLIFCVPLKGRRESDEDEHLTFDDTLDELKEIIRLSDEGTRRAMHVKCDDQQARASWWAERGALDKRLKELLENIEFCWLGAFKTILSRPVKTPPDVITSLRAQFDKVFQRSLQLQDKKQKTRIRLDDTLLECFSALSPNCQDEELEDLIYFILDLYQFHGVPVAIAEVDVVQVVVDLRIALEEHTVKTKGRIVPEEDSHMFLVLDKNVQGIPWESIPILRGRSVSRIPSMEFLVDRLEFVRWRKGEDAAEVVDRAVVDPRKTYYVLNPSGDLGKTEGRFANWVKDMNKVGWRGYVGRPPSEQEFLDALSREDLVIYFGHGGGEQYVRSHKIRNLPRCAATMLWGCSSGALRDMGDFDRVGTPYNYMLAGCPTLVANIWDVTDRDIDKYSQSVFEKMRMTASDVGRWRPEVEHGKVSLVTAVARSRDSCKLKYLTGAAPVVYGIPFYL